MTAFDHLIDSGSTFQSAQMCLKNITVQQSFLILCISGRTEN